MTKRKLLSAASALALLVAASSSAQEKNPVLDANGNVCSGILDSSKQCFAPEATRNTPERPYREAGVAFDPRPRNPFARRQRELIYIAVPGGYSDQEDAEVKTGEGIIVLDAKRNFAFVGRIHLQGTPLSMVPESVSGMMASPATNMLYVSTRGHLIAMDLATDKVVWSNAYEPGTCCERGQVTPDGLTLEVGSNLKNFHRVIDARTGAVKGVIETPMSMLNHNMAMSPDGKTVFDAPNGFTMTVADMGTMKATKTITFEDHIRVFVINHDATRIYVNLNNLLGFVIADVKTGKVIKRIEAPAELWKAKWADPNAHYFGHGAPQHGVGLTPDESEIWVADDINNQILVYDNEGNDNWKRDTAKTIKTAHPANWITMGLDGRLAYLSSGDIVDVNQHKIVAQMKDEYGNVIYSEKVLDMMFDNGGHLQRTVNQFAEGMPEAVASRLGKR
jgi:DNA-binding beta-propeller fold protein YncE